MNFEQIHAQYSMVDSSSYENILIKEKLLDHAAALVGSDPQKNLWLATQYNVLAREIYSFGSSSPMMFVPRVGSKAYELNVKSKAFYDVFLASSHSPVNLVK